MTDDRQPHLYRWQCSDGCKHLKQRVGVNGYDCTFWDTLPDTLSNWPLRRGPCGIIPKTRIEGPHRDAPTMPCYHFKLEGEEPT